MVIEKQFAHFCGKQLKMAFLTWSLGDTRSHPNCVKKWPDFEYSDRWLIANEQDFIFDIDHMLSKSVGRENACDNNESGIYILFRGNEATYVGQSKVLSIRLCAHSNRLLEASKDFDKYFIINVPVYFLDDIESIYINSLSPPDNLARGRSAFKFPPKTVTTRR